MAAVNNFIQQYSLPYDFALDAPGEMAGLYQLRGVPTTFFIAPDGVIKDITMGVATADWVAENLASIDG